MPVQHGYTIKQGTTSKLLLIYARQADEPSHGKTGLRSDAAGATAGYIREGEQQAIAVPLVPGDVGRYTSGGFIEVDARLLPGVYQFGAPDALLAEGSARAILVLQFPGATIEPVEIHLVAYDPQDAERMGVWGLANHKRHEFLRRALPRLTEMEYELGEKAERALHAQIEEANSGTHA
jgi:hypothetical protein